MERSISASERTVIISKGVYIYSRLMHTSPNDFLFRAYKQEWQDYTKDYGQFIETVIKYQKEIFNNSL